MTPEGDFMVYPTSSSMWSMLPTVLCSLVMEYADSDQIASQAIQAAIRAKPFVFPEHFSVIAEYVRNIRLSSCQVPVEQIRSITTHLQEVETFDVEVVTMDKPEDVIAHLCTTTNLRQV